MIKYKDRKTGKIETEKIYHEKVLNFLYNGGFINHLCCHFLSRIPLNSKFYGFLQNLPFSKKKIVPFIEEFQLDPKEFLEPIDKYNCFNDFFTRKLKKEARPIVPGEDIAVIPADGRFLFFQNIAHSDGFFVKGKKFSLETLLGSSRLSNEYAAGSLVLGRLAPSDYHRFHFPCAGVPGYPRLINGALYSVNPLAVKKHISILSENKRMITEIATEKFGKILYIEVGATMVGSINETFTPQKYVHKGDEKGFFSFGGSSVILIFEANKIQFDKDLIDASKDETSNDLVEIRCLMGQSMGVIAQQ